MNEYEKKFKECWNEGCGLIAPVYVAKMLGLKGEAASVIPIWKKRKFKVYYLNGGKKPLLAYKDFLTVQEYRKTAKTALSVESSTTPEDTKK